MDDFILLTLEYSDKKVILRVSDIRNVASDYDCTKVRMKNEDMWSVCESVEEVYYEITGKYKKV